MSSSSPVFYKPSTNIAYIDSEPYKKDSKGKLQPYTLMTGEDYQEECDEDGGSFHFCYGEFNEEPPNKKFKLVEVVNLAKRIRPCDPDFENYCNDNLYDDFEVFIREDNKSLFIKNLDRTSHYCYYDWDDIDDESETYFTSYKIKPTQENAYFTQEIKYNLDFNDDSTIGNTEFKKIEEASNSVNNLRGSKKADKLFSSSVGNKIKARDGNDLIFGNDGDDTFIGGGGADRFYLSNGKDIIIDFQTGYDKIIIDKDLEDSKLITKSSYKYDWDDDCALYSTTLEIKGTDIKTKLKGLYIGYFNDFDIVYE